MYMSVAVRVARLVAVVLAVVQLVSWLGSPFVRWLGFGAELVVWPWRQKPRFGLRQRKKWLGFGAELVVVWPWRQNKHVCVVDDVVGVAAADIVLAIVDAGHDVASPW